MSKLVRDKIPEIIMKDDLRVVIQTARDDHLNSLLMDKLYEEIAEFQDAQNSRDQAEELADVLEVIDAMTRQIGYNPEQIMRIKNVKRAERGGFFKGIVLISTIDPLNPRVPDVQD